MARGPDDIDDATWRLILARGIGPATLRKLLDHFGSAAAAVAAGPRQLRSLDGVGERTAVALRTALDVVDPDLERRLLHEHDVRIVLHGDDDYPRLLGPLPDAPSALWVRGAWTGKDVDAIAIVGSRRPSVYGREQAARLAAHLADAGLVVVSGGARGIDEAAHRACLRVGGRTIAVLGCGLAHVYPPESRTLFDTIARAGGAVVSELPMDCPPRPAHFPRRNRVISGLSVGVVVVEASRRSGALITARYAADDHGRDVMAVPGAVDMLGSEGCHELIRSGAALVRHAGDVLETIAETRRLNRRRPAAATPVDLSPRQQAIMTHLEGRDAIALEALAAAIDAPVSELLGDVTILELTGLASRPAPGFVGLGRGG